MYDLLVVSWSRSAPALRCTFCCRCLGLEVVPQHEDARIVAGVLVSKWCPSTKMYDFLPVSWSRSGTPARRCTICCRCLGLLPVSWSRSGAPALGYTICCRYLGLGAMPQHEDVLLFWVSLSRRGAPALRYTICCRCLGSGAPALRCTNCFRCLGLEVAPQH